MTSQCVHAGRGGQMSSARELHAQEGRLGECGGFCVHNATTVATMVSTSCSGGRVYIGTVQLAG
jgi:hypothetical protein